MTVGTDPSARLNAEACPRNFLVRPRPGQCAQKGEAHDGQTRADERDEWTRTRAGERPSKAECRAARQIACTAPDSLRREAKADNDPVPEYRAA